MTQTELATLKQELCEEIKAKLIQEIIEGQVQKSYLAELLYGIHAELLTVVSDLREDDNYTKEKATLDLLSVMYDLREYAK